MGPRAPHPHHGVALFPLIALASCAYILLADTALGDSPDARARAIQGLMTGIGFVGGGAILKNGGGNVTGTATAVSIWTTGAIGATVALGAYDIAVLVSVLNFAILRILGSLKSEVGQNND